MIRATTKQRARALTCTQEHETERKKIEPETFYGKEMIFKGDLVLFTADLQPTHSRDFWASDNVARECLFNVCAHVFFVSDFLFFFLLLLVSQRWIEWMDEAAAHRCRSMMVMIKRVHECIPSERTLNALFPLNESCLSQIHATLKNYTVFCCLSNI